MVTIHSESAVVPEPLGRRALPPWQGSRDTSPGYGGLQTSKLPPGTLLPTSVAAHHHRHPLLVTVGDRVLTGWTVAWRSSAMLRVL